MIFIYLVILIQIVTIILNTISYLKNVTIKLKNVINDSTVDTVHFIKEKTLYFQEIMRNTILSIQKYKYHEIFSNSDVVTTIQIINELYEKLAFQLF
jgi:hypothetical protein